MHSIWELLPQKSKVALDFKAIGSCEYQFSKDYSFFNMIGVKI